MIFKSNKAFQEAVGAEIWKDREKREQEERINRIERRIAELEMQLYDVRMKTDPVFRDRHEPRCECANAEMSMP